MEVYRLLSEHARTHICMPSSIIYRSKRIDSKLKARHLSPHLDDLISTTRLDDVNKQHQKRSTRLSPMKKRQRQGRQRRRRRKRECRTPTSFCLSYLSFTRETCRLFWACYFPATLVWSRLPEHLSQCLSLSAYLTFLMIGNSTSFEA